MRLRYRIFTVLALASTAASLSARDTAIEKLLGKGFYTDKALWKVPDVVQVGYILETDPALWASPQGASFVPYSKYFIGRVPLGDQSHLSETLQLDRKADIGLLIPLAHLFATGAGIDFSHTRRLTLTATNEDIDQIGSDYDVDAAIQRGQSDRTKDVGQSGQLRQVERGASLAVGDATKARYWMVTKVYRAADFSWGDQNSTGVAVGLVCLSTPAAPTIDNSSSSDAKAPQAASSHPGASTAAGSSAKSSESKPNALNTVEGVASTAVSGVKGAAVATKEGGSSKGAESPKAKCGLLNAGTVSQSSPTASGKDTIVFVQLRPIFMNQGARTLYLGSSAKNGNISSPKIVNRSS